MNSSSNSHNYAEGKWTSCSPKNGTPELGNIYQLNYNLENLDKSLMELKQAVPSKHLKYLRIAMKKMIKDSLYENNMSLFDNSVNNFKDYSNTKIKKVYNGIKTEFIDKSSRNYNYKIINEGKNGKVFTVIPGKFTLSFSLAIEIYKTIFKKMPKTKKKINKRQLINKKIISISKHNILWN